MEASTVKSHLPRITRLTDENDHTGALMQLAVVCGHEQIRKCLQGIRTIQNAEAETPSQIIEYRRELQNRLLAYIADRCPEIETEVRQSL